MVNHTSGPLGSANQEIRAASMHSLRGARGRRLPSLLKRTDRDADRAETLNLLKVRRAPASWYSELSALVTDLPFEYQPHIAQHPSDHSRHRRCVRHPERSLPPDGQREFEDELLEAATCVGIIGAAWNPTTRRTHPRLDFAKEVD